MAEVLRIDPVEPEPNIIQKGADLLLHGEVVAIPTDTFYGLAANPFNRAAVEKIFAIKERPSDKPLLLLIDSMPMAEELSVSLPQTFRLLAEKFWPGPLTLVVNASPKLSSAVTAGTGTIGLRFPVAPIALALIRAARCPITATSANLSGEPDSASAQQVQSALGERLSMILDGGASQLAKPSTVVSVINQDYKILREGAIAAKDIKEWLSGGLEVIRKD